MHNVLKRRFPYTSCDVIFTELYVSSFKVVKITEFSEGDLRLPP